MIAAACTPVAGAEGVLADERVVDRDRELASPRATFWQSARELRQVPVAELAEQLEVDAGSGRATRCRPARRCPRIVPCTRSAPYSSAQIEFTTARPRSLWPCQSIADLGARRLDDVSRELDEVADAVGRDVADGVAEASAASRRDRWRRGRARPAARRAASGWCPR